MQGKRRTSRIMASAIAMAGPYSYASIRDLKEMNRIHIRCSRCGMNPPPGRGFVGGRCKCGGKYRTR